MVILLSGASHTGKTRLAQQLMEQLHIPYLSIDHLKMGLIRSGQTTLTPTDDRQLTDYLWSIVREMVQTVIENHQNLIVEGCYIPFHWKEDFSPQSLRCIRSLFLVMSEEYIRSHFPTIRSTANVIEQRLDDSLVYPRAAARGQPLLSGKLHPTQLPHCLHPRRVPFLRAVLYSARAVIPYFYKRMVSSMLFREIFFICFGYLLGSILFARLFGLLFAHKDITQNTADGNPGTANAFLQGGFLCGVCTLLGDLFKGYLPVAWYLSTQNQPTVPPLAFALLIAAPVLGHIFPLFHHLHGGKGIATSFGCLLALLPDPVPVLTLAFFFLFFSCIVRISPHFYRTIVTYLCSFVALCFSNVSLSVRLGFLLITAGVFLRMHLSQESKERCTIKLLWMR